ncbi:hypothetical protein PLICRDRAFT_46351 [Plicaturopsis crispa FD-325 SS-3]|uniref:F-box domain-containing protein n=1 Tax=Plicaturopsis crispa FD-325 SS-3 TaxID=944288 RepID=A0A0C9SXK4_PLICR|nr:hypothetical protein PLICRDRAFT_46351 [Plicaturopsis crispa FD-325 SS-3]
MHFTTTDQNPLKEIFHLVERLRVTKAALRVQRDELQRRQDELVLQEETVELMLVHAAADIAEIDNMRVPIALLPNEVLGMIFEAGDRMDAQTYRRNPSLRSFRTLVTSVSRHWRSVAIGMAQLWTTVYINMAMPPRQIPILEDIMGRSRTAELSLSLHARAYNDPSDPRTARFMDIICSRIDRVRELTVTTRDSQFPLEVFTCLGPLVAPVLRRLTLNGNNIPKWTAENRVELFRGGAPALGALDYDGFDMVYFAGIHHKSITTLRIHSNLNTGLLFHDLPHFLGNFAALERLHVTDYLVRDLAADASRFSESATLPALRSVVFSGGSVPGILAFFRAPLLDTVVLEECNILITPIERRTYPTVRTLTLKNCFYHDSQDVRVHIMDVFPNAVHLSIIEKVDRCITPWLRCDDDRLRKWPLQKISLHCPPPIYRSSRKTDLDQLGALCEVLSTWKAMRPVVPDIYISTRTIEDAHCTSLDRLKTISTVVEVPNEAFSTM